MRWLSMSAVSLSLCPLPCSYAGQQPTQRHKRTYTQMGKQSHCLLFSFFYYVQRDSLLLIFSQKEWWQVVNVTIICHIFSQTEKHTKTECRPSTTLLYWVCHAPVTFYYAVFYLKYADDSFVFFCPSLDAHSLGLRSIYYCESPWWDSGALCVHIHTNRAQHSWGHSLSTSGLDFCHCSLTNHPTTHKKDAPGPQRERGLLLKQLGQSLLGYKQCIELLLACSHWIWPRKEEEDVGTGSGGKERERWGKRWKGERDVWFLSFGGLW